MDGIKKAKERGIKFDRRNKLSIAQLLVFKAMREQGTLIKELMQEYELSKASVYRLLGDVKENPT